MDPETEELDLTGMRQKEIPHLEQLKKLSSLCLRWNLIKKIENVSALTSLTYLELYDNQVLLIFQSDNFLFRNSDR